MHNELFEFVDSDAKAGFRLQRLEVYNWGTFHRRVWSVTPSGNTSLLTGDIGSGKSTLVDAITTLLVSPRRVAYNKAAGADADERSLRTYVLGHYKAARGDDSLTAKPVALRDHNSYSVVLGHFRNTSYTQDVTLAQVFWQPDGQGQPNRFYVVAECALTIAQDFADFGTDLSDLRKRLRNQSGVKLYERFPQYGAHFRRLFGIGSDQALDLFHQTVSMKSVGSLTDFVRGHMLEAFDVTERIEALIRHFDDLDRAHKAVLKAKSQIEMLNPLDNDLDRYGELLRYVEELQACRAALRPWFASLKGDLLKKRLERLAEEIERYNARIANLERDQTVRQDQRDDLNRAIAESGGDRIARLERQIGELGSERQKRQRRAEDYGSLVERLSFDRISDTDGFQANLRAAKKERENLEDQRVQAENARTEATVALRDVRTTHQEVTAELESLRSRPTNIPLKMLRLRQELCAAVGLGEDELPFVGELIEVKQDAQEWEGAIERLLHNFGLSLLVADRHYRIVAEWIDRTHLNGRLVYYRARPRRVAAFQLHSDSAVYKLSIHPSTEFSPWLQQELAHRFNYACCYDLDRFRKELRAITRAGQIKGSGERHEKDDRHSITDRTRYILGWSNEPKIAALERQAQDLERQLQTIGVTYSQAQQEEQRVRQRDEMLIRLEGFRDFQEMDWGTVVLQIQRLERELHELTAASDQLRVLREQLVELENAIEQKSEALHKQRDERAKRTDRRDLAQQLFAESQAILREAPDAVRGLFPKLEALRSEALPERKLSVESADNLEGEMREWLQGRIDGENKRLERLRDRIIKAMGDFKREWPLDTQDVDVSIEASGEYRAMLQRLLDDDLPSFESRFRELLRKNTIREIANFQAQLNREQKLIGERVDRINKSLHGIDYNPNRYIRLHAEESPDIEVRQFREALKACTEGALTGSEDDQYSELKFMQVKAIIERFQGREGAAESDRRWTRKVTDVRNWFVFAASERWREDDTEDEYYTGAGGKSGGQKEKLAYTVLAASLAYQFGLEWGERRSRSFRFVVIDEAFGRGSDESSKYGLELFQRLNLQLLIVTPLQKIHVIEPYVNSVAFVYNEDDRNSMVRNLSIEEYHVEKAAHAGIQVS